MIILIHGNDTGQSRLKLRSLLEEKSREKIYLDGKKTALQEILLACEASPLLASVKTVVVENFFQRQASSDKKKIWQYLIESEIPSDLIFWEGKEIDYRKIKSLPQKITVFKFDYPSSLFKFMDSLGALSKKETLRQFHLLLKNYDAQLIFSFLIRQFRFLIMVSDNAAVDLGIPGWQFYKYKKQAGYFELSRPIALYRQLLQIDYKIKTGGTPQSLADLLDIFLVNL